MQVDLIPHTGVIVYGEEYFFGGGIQHCPHHQFVASHMPPVELREMGTTELPKEFFLEFLEELGPRFNMSVVLALLTYQA